MHEGKGGLNLESGFLLCNPFIISKSIGFAPLARGGCICGLEKDFDSIRVALIRSERHKEEVPHRVCRLF